MIILAMYVVVPIALAMLLLHIRRGYGLPQYFAATLPFLAAAFVVWGMWPEITFYYRGPLHAAGYFSWGLPVTVFAISAICAPRFKAAWARTLQVVACVFVTIFVLRVLAGWIA